MSSQLMSFVSPITDRLESLQNQFTQLAALHREAQTSLRSQGVRLTGSSGIDAFVGDGAVAFSAIIEHYINASEKHMQLLDEAASTTASCISDVIGVAGYASSSSLDDGLVAQVLGQLNPDMVIREGGSPVQTIIDQMKQTLNDMIHRGGDFFGHLIHGDVGGAIHDVGQEIGDVGQLDSEVLSLLEDVGHVLIQWAQNICDAVGNFLKTVGSLILKIGDFFLGISSMVHDIQVIFDGKTSLKDKLLAVGDFVLNAGTDVLMITGVGEEIRGGVLAVKGAEDLATKGEEDIVSRGGEHLPKEEIRGGGGYPAEGTSWNRNITKTSEMDPNLLKQLHYKGEVSGGGRSGGVRDLYGEPNSYVQSTGGHTLIYDEQGRLIYDISEKRVKMTVWDRAPNGKPYPRDVKLEGFVPHEWLDLLPKA